MSTRGGARANSGPRNLKAFRLAPGDTVLLNEVGTEGRTMMRQFRAEAIERDNERGAIVHLVEFTLTGHQTGQTINVWRM